MSARAQALAPAEDDLARFLAVAALAVGLTAAADDTAAKDELARFAGTWKGVSVSQDGKELAKPEAEAHRLVVEGRSTP